MVASNLKNFMCAAKALSKTDRVHDFWETTKQILQGPEGWQPMRTKLKKLTTEHLKKEKAAAFCDEVLVNVLSEMLTVLPASNINIKTAHIETNMKDAERAFLVNEFESENVQNLVNPKKQVKSRTTLPPKTKTSTAGMAQKTKVINTPRLTALTDDTGSIQRLLKIIRKYNDAKTSENC